MSKLIFEGDLVFFRSSGKWYEQLICQVTHGPYCHIGIALDSLRILAANPGGIDVSPAPINTNTFDVLDISAHAERAKMKEALIWAFQQKGKDYGWTDIVYQAIKFLFPNNPFQLTEQNHWDCSDFCTRYVQKAGVDLPDQYSDPYRNTPNDLARLFQLI